MPKHIFQVNMEIEAVDRNAAFEIVSDGLAEIQQGLIAGNKVLQWVGIGWVEERIATDEDRKTLPSIS